MDWNQLLGPNGLLVGALVLIAILLRDHQRADSDDRKERDDWKALALASERDIGALTSTLKPLLNKTPPAP